MFVRRKKNRSGSTSVVVADKSSGRFTELHVIGVGTTEDEIRKLVNEGKNWIAHELDSPLRWTANHKLP